MINDTLTCISTTPLYSLLIAEYTSETLRYTSETLRYTSEYCTGDFLFFKLSLDLRITVGQN